MALRTRHLARFVFQYIDRWYRVRHGLLPLGPMLLLGREQYQGEAREFADGTRLLARQAIGVLHFNNQCIAGLEEGSRQSVGVKFARLFRESLQQLAQRAQSDPAMHDVTVYHGLTWFRGHGLKVGFISEPLPEGWRQRWLRQYFRLLAWGFSPVKYRSDTALQPRCFWITRNALIKYFGNAAQS